MEHDFKKDELIYIAKDYIKSNKEFFVYKDSSTEILWTDFPPSLKHKESYGSEKYKPHTKQKNLFNRLYKISQNFMFYYKRILLGRELIVSKRVLDFGSGDGAFFKFMHSPSLIIDALDPFFKAENIDQKNFYSNISQVPDNQYDIVFMWHSLEHVQMLESTINEVYKKIKANGSLIVAVPNHKSFDAIYYRDKWAALDVPRHLWHFTTKSIKKMMLKHGFKLKRSFPLLLDAYYISYMSANYKKSFFPIFQGLLIGTVSNFIGIFSGQFSSNTYVFEKKD